MKGITLDGAVDGAAVTMSSVVVNESGQQQRAAETFCSDGTETKGTLNAGVTLIASWVGSHVPASVAEKGGQMVALVTYEVSDDGKTLTARSSGTLEQVIVCDRK